MSYVFLKDPKFWTAVADFVFSTALMLIGKYVAPELADVLTTVVISFQPIVAMIIVGLLQAQNAALSSGKSISAFKE